MVRRLLGVALGIVLLLPVLAHASPPDSTWIGGFYDDADYDDVVLLITTDPVSPPVPFVQCPDPHRVTVWLIPLGDETRAAATTLRPRLSRGPPLS